MLRAVVVVSGLVVLQGCCCSLPGGLGDKLEEKVSEKVGEQVTEKVLEHQLGGDADVDLSSGSLKITTNEGSMTIDADASSLPADFPVKLHPSGKVVGSMKLPASDGNGVVYVVTTEIPGVDIATATSFYTDQLGGWENVSSMSVAGEGETRMLKKDPWQLMLQVGAQGDGTQVMISATNITASP